MDNSGNEESRLTQGSFKTLIEANAYGQFTFISSSCVMIGRRWRNGLPEFKSAIDLEPRFALFLGDTVYVDVPYSLTGVGSSLDAFHAKYRETYMDSTFQEFGRTVPTFFMYDDHEIVNNYVGSEAIMLRY